MSYETDMKYLLQRLDSLESRLRFQERLETPGILTVVTDYVPTYGGFSSDPTHVVVYAYDTKMCHFWFWATTNGTSNATSFTMSSPFTAKTVGGMSYVGSMGRYTDNGAASVRGEGRIYIQSGTSTIYLQTAASTGAWTASGNKSASGMISFPID